MSDYSIDMYQSYAEMAINYLGDSLGDYLDHEGVNLHVYESTEYDPKQHEDTEPLPTEACFLAAAKIKAALESIDFTCVRLHEVGGWFRAPSKEAHFVSVWVAPADSLYEVQEYGLD